MTHKRPRIYPQRSLSLLSTHGYIHGYIHGFIYGSTATLDILIVHELSPVQRDSHRYFIDLVHYAALPRGHIKLSIAPCRSVCLSVHPFRASDFLEIGKVEEFSLR